MFLRKVVLKIWSKFTREHPCRSVISINFIEITLGHGCSPVTLLHIFRTPFCKNTSGGLLLYCVYFPYWEDFRWHGLIPFCITQTSFVNPNSAGLIELIDKIHFLRSFPIRNFAAITITIIINIIVVIVITDIILIYIFLPLTDDIKGRSAKERFIFYFRLKITTCTTCTCTTCTCTCRVVIVQSVHLQAEVIWTELLWNQSKPN